MSVVFEWRRWTISPEHDAQSGDKAIVKALNVAIKHSPEDPVNVFGELWRSWNESFPKGCVLVTLTLGPNPQDQHSVQQLRLWFGEPASFRKSGYVDSMGHNLIVHIGGHEKDLIEITKWLIKKEEFREGLYYEAPGKNPWTRSDSNIIVWRRI